MTPARIAYGAAALAALVSLLLRASLPISAEGYLMHDDALFVKLAQSIAKGEWLGAFDNLTLAKGVFYSLFVAAAHLASIPLPLAEQLVYLGAAALAALAFARAAASRNAGIVLFVLLALDPALFHSVLTRVIREALYMSLGLALVALAMLVVFAPSAKLNAVRIAQLAGLALLGAAYWLTREESIWLYPALVVVAAGGLAQALIARRGESLAATARQLAAPIAAQTAIAVAALGALIGAVALTNQAQYGVAITNEFREGAFPSAYGALQRIEPAAWSQYEIFDETVAANAYEVSPAARELKAGLDGENGAMWRTIGCNAFGSDPCPKAFIRGWFMWALRDAALLAGHYKSASEAQAYFTHLAAEINEACDAGRIKCGPRRDVMTPPLDARYLTPWLSSFGDALAVIAHMRGVDVGAVASKGREDQIATFARMAGPVAPIAPFALVGWAASRVCVPKAKVIDEAGGAILARATYESAADVEAHFAKAGAKVPATRFRIVSDCRAASCRLAFEGCAPIAPQPLADVQPGWIAGTGEVLVRIDSVSNEASTEPVADGGIAYALMWMLAQIYRVLVPLLLIAGLAGTVIAAIGWRRLGAHIPLATLVAASAAAVLARAAIIAAFDVTASPVVNPLYLSPAAPFALVFGLAGAWLGWRCREAGD